MIRQAKNLKRGDIIVVKGQDRIIEDAFRSKHPNYKDRIVVEFREGDTTDFLENKEFECKNIV